MDKYYVVSFSGGKDSTAMLLRLIELKCQIDEVIFCDTYKEFPAMYNHIKKVRAFVESKGIKFTELKNEKNFDYFMFEHPVRHRNPETFRAKYGDSKGYSWASVKTRWCTKHLKISVMGEYFKQLEKRFEVIQYIGLAADETKRLERKNNQQKNHRHPLVEWGWTEEDCLQYCYSLGYDWDGLYKYFDRVSCWCCPLQSLDDLRKLRKFFPKLWQELIKMDQNTWFQFRADYSVAELDKRFSFEEQRLAEGKSIRNREFFTLLKEYLKDA